MNLIFTNPLYLFGAFFSLIPLIIHILYKRKIKVVPFSSLQYIKTAHSQNSKKFKLKEWLLLLIRTLIILFLILAAAKPTIQTQKKGLPMGQNNKNKRIIIILDNSLSMGYTQNSRSLFDIAQDKASQLIENFYQKGDLVSIIPSASLDHYVYRELYTKEKITKKIKSLSLTYGESQILKSLRLIQNHLNTAIQLNTTVYIISDFQNSNFSNKLNLSSKPNYNLVLLDIGPKETFNTYVKKLSIPSLFYGLHNTIPIHCTVKNTGTLKGSIINSVFLNNKKIGQQNFTLASYEKKDMSFESKIEKSGMLLGHIVLQGDKLKYDNGYYFVDKIPESLHILIVDDFQRADFLKSVFNSVQYNKTLHYKIITSDNLSELSKYDILIFNSFKKIDSNQSSLIKQFLNSNKPVFFFLSPNLDMNSFNSLFYLKNIIPIRLLNLISTIDESSNYFKIKDVNYAHEALSIFKEYNFFPTVKIYKYYKTDYDISNPNLNILIRLQNEAPILMEYSYLNKKERPAGKIYLMTTGVGNKMNDLVYHPNFPVFIFQLLRYGIKRDTPSFFPNTEIDTIKNTLSIEGVPQLFQYNFLTKRFEQKSDKKVIKPGIYKLNDSIFTVNINSAESDLTKVSEKKLKMILGNFTYIENDKNNSDIIYLTQGRSLSPLFIILAIILLLVELLVANKIKIPKIGH